MSTTLKTLLGVVAGITTVAAMFFVPRLVLTCIFC